jgi:hypothetical protein
MLELKENKQCYQNRYSIWKPVDAFSRALVSFSCNVTLSGYKGISILLKHVLKTKIAGQKYIPCKFQNIK